MSILFVLFVTLVPFFVSLCEAVRVKTEKRTQLAVGKGAVVLGLTQIYCI